MSTVIAGPRRLYTYDTLALRILDESPVTMYVLSMASESWYTSVLKSSFITPRNDKSVFVIVLSIKSVHLVLLGRVILLFILLLGKDSPRL